MRSPRVLGILLIGLLLASGAPGRAQPAAGAKPYEPEVGQTGKDVVWVPTADALVEKMLDLAEVTSSDYVIDLGSGDGRTVIAAARRGARALGVEYNPDMVALSRRNAEKAGVAKHASFVTADLYKTDLSRATVITMFLLPEINMKLRPSLLGLKPGTRIVSNSFSLEDWEADKRAVVEGEDAGCSSWCTALLWIVPAKVEGTWRLPDGELVLSQKFQMLSGTLRKAPLSQGRVRGTEVSFSVGKDRYSGSVRANSMWGTVTTGEARRTWAATRAVTTRASRQDSGRTLPRPN